MRQTPESHSTGLPGGGRKLAGSQALETNFEKSRGTPVSHSPAHVSPARLPTRFGLAVFAWLPAAWLSFLSLVQAQQTPPPEVQSKVLEQARRALVRVELYLKALPDEEGPGGMGETTSSQALDQQQRQVIRFKKPIQMMGIVVAPRELLVPDTGVSPERIDRWEVTDTNGVQTQARAAALLRDAPTLVLAPTDANVTWRPAEFAEAEIAPASSLILVTPDWAPLDLRWLLRVSNISAVSRWDASPDAETAPFWIVGSLSTGSVATDPTTVGEAPAAAVSLVFNSSGQLLGAGLADRIFADRSVPPWRAAHLRAASRISCEEMEKLQQQLTENVAATLYPVRIEYRRPRGGFQALQESELLGWAVGERLLLAPWEIYRQIAARIARITVHTRSTDVEAEFIGQVQELSAILVKLPDASEPFPAYADLGRAGQMHTYRPNIALTLARKYGTNDLRVQYTRSLGLEYGYRNRPSPRLTPAPSIGSLVLDPDGRVIGLFARARRPIEELELIQTLARQGAAANVSSVELFEVSQLAQIVRDPVAAVDPRVVRREEKEQDRRAWLGVETSALSKDLAESLGCRKESKDGAIGVMVNQIYAGSPAEQIGLRTGDVLLSLEVPERDQPVLLTMPRGGRGQGEAAQFGGSEAGQGSGRAPWPSQNNFLNGVLSIIGEGTELELAYWRDGKLEHVSFPVEQAPPDQDSAAQYKDEQLGITVKELTFEVRAALRMKPDDVGVVVAKVESGTPAGRARINSHEIIQAANGEPVDSPDKFESVVKKAQEQKKDQLRLTVVDRGRSRFADLKFTQ
jgi:hypothetical protein